MFLNIPDACQADVVNDLLMLKSHGRNRNAVRNQTASDTQRNIGTADVPYEVTSVVQGYSHHTERLQSITAMKEYRKLSFEVKRNCR